MLRGIYAAASGMGTQLDAVSVYANNIANAATSGFKRNELISRPFNELVVKLAGNETGNVGLGVGTAFAKTELNQGALVETGNPLNLAIQGDGYFEVEGTQPDGTTIRVRGCDLWVFRDSRVVRKDSYWKIVEP